MKRTTLALAIVVVVIIIVSSSITLATLRYSQNNNHGERGLYIIVTVPPLADVVGRVAGDRAVVESLIKPGVNLATYELTPADSERIADAHLFLYVGYGYEAVLGAYADGIKNGVGVVRMLDKVLEKRIENAAEIPNPYFWLDPTKVEKLVQKIVPILIEIDPSGAEEYGINAKRYIEELQQLDEWIKARISTLQPSERKLVSVRNTMQYFADRYGLEIVGYVTGYAGTYEPQTRSVIELFETAVAEGVPVFFVEYEEAATTLREVIETLAEKAGVDVVEFLYIESLAPDYGVNTYIDMMKKNTEVIVSSLSTSPKASASRGSDDGIFDNPILRPFKYEFMQRGAITLILAIVAASLVGSFAVIRGWAIFADALAHGSIIGLVAAYLMSFDFFLGALTAGLVVAIIVSSVERRTKLRTDVIIAVTFTTMLALAIAILSYIGGATLSIEDILFADVTAVSTEMMTRTIILSTAITVFALLFGRVLLIYTVDPLGANALGMRTGAVHYGLLLLLAFATVSAFMTIGAIPAIAALIIPPATAFLTSKRPTEFIAKSMAIAGSSAVAGLYISYYVGTNAGAAAVLVSAALFASAVVYRSLKK
ncbi:MAG: zinc ABC transporter substrate-binding protein [Aigarchaeota archaeon]|nr:zinc ABC transporter substrate-binding protein [Candidatus Pelearchaeum maunauluense]